MVEPKYPGAVERYVNVGECYDSGALYDIREDLMSCMSGYKGCYQRAYRCLRASAELAEDVRATLLTEPLADKLARRARGILARELPTKKGAKPGQVRQRFLGAVTHRGPVCLFDTVLAQCDRVYELADQHGMAHEMLIHLLSGAVTGGYDVVACPDPMAPERLAHLLVPERKLAFVTSTAQLPFPGTHHRRIRLDGAADGGLLRGSRPQLRFARKVSAALLDEAVAALDQAKTMHDQLEALYNPHVDFDRVDELVDEIGEEILSF